jgi:hypothetical protein
LRYLSPPNPKRDVLDIPPRERPIGPFSWKEIPEKDYYVYGNNEKDVEVKQQHELDRVPHCDQEREEGKGRQGETATLDVAVEGCQIVEHLVPRLRLVIHCHAGSFLAGR